MGGEDKKIKTVRVRCQEKIQGGKRVKTKLLIQEVRQKKRRSLLSPTTQPQTSDSKLPWSPLALVQEGGGDEDGLTTGAKADFCLTAADTMLAGEKEKTPEEEEQLEGREVEEAMVGLDGTTGAAGEKG